jgi:tetratricopeptide (TPR) repeat protein
MNRLAALIVLTSACTGIGSATAADEGSSWVGELVINKKPAKEIEFCDVVDGKQVYFSFSGKSPFKVRADRDGWLRIHDGSREGWVQKSDFVLAGDAPAYFHQRVQANPKDTWALYMRGVGWKDKGELDNAIKDYDECIRLNPTDSAAFNARGNAWSDKKDFDKAIKDYDEAIRLDPKSALAFNNRGNAWSDKKDFDKAIKDYDEAIRLDPKNAVTFNNRGNAWSNKKERDKAIKDYDEAIRLDPKNAVAFNNRGAIWSDKYDYDKAIRDYGEAIRLDPKNAVAFNNRGNAWNNKKAHDRAIQDYDQAIRLDPKNAVAFNNRGNAWSNKEEYDRAIRDYDEAIRLDPKNSRTFFSRSVAQMVLQRPDASKGFQGVLELQEYKGELALYAVVLGHLAARQAGDETAAKRFLKDSEGKLDDAWPNPVVRFLRGEIDETTLLALANSDEKRTDVCCFLGIDHLLRGRKAEAISHFRWVKEHGVVGWTEYTIAMVELERLEGSR